MTSLPRIVYVVKGGVSSLERYLSAGDKTSHSRSNSKICSMERKGKEGIERFQVRVCHIVSVKCEELSECALEMHCLGMLNNDGEVNFCESTPTKKG